MENNLFPCFFFMSISVTLVIRKVDFLSRSLLLELALHTFNVLGCREGGGGGVLSIILAAY